MQDIADQIRAIPVAQLTPMGRAALADLKKPIYQRAIPIPTQTAILTYGEKSSGTVLDGVRLQLSNNTAPVINYMRASLERFVPVPGGVESLVSYAPLGLELLRTLKTLSPQNRRSRRANFERGAFFPFGGLTSSWKEMVRSTGRIIDDKYTQGLVAGGLAPNSALYYNAINASKNARAGALFGYFEPITNFLKTYNSARAVGGVPCPAVVVQEMTAGRHTRRTIKRQSWCPPRWEPTFEAYRNWFWSQRARDYRAKIGELQYRVGMATARDIAFKAGAEARQYLTPQQSQGDPVKQFGFNTQNAVRARLIPAPGGLNAEISWSGQVGDEWRVIVRSLETKADQSRLILQPERKRAGSGGTRRFEKTVFVRIPKSAQRSGKYLLVAKPVGKGYFQEYARFDGPIPDRGAPAEQASSARRDARRPAPAPPDQESAPRAPRPMGQFQLASLAVPVAALAALKVFKVI